MCIRKNTAKKHRKASRLVNYKLRNRSRTVNRTAMLFDAVSKRKVHLVKQLLKEGNLHLSARYPNDEKLTLLHFNAVHGDAAITRHLVQAGCKIDSTDCEGFTALHYAINDEQFEVASQLIRLGANVHAKNRNGNTPLHSTMTSMMLRSESRNNISRSKAARSIGIVKMLLNAGAEVNTMNVYEITPIHYAARTGNLELVKLLIDAGADVNSQSGTGPNALDQAIDCCDEAMVLLLLRHGASVAPKALSGNNPLYEATQLNTNNSHEAIIRRLLEFGSDVNCVNQSGWTPFHNMIQNCDINTLSLCIDKVNMKQLDLDGYSYLHFVAFNKDQDVMNLMLDSGIPLDSNSNVTGKTVLHFACDHINPEYVRRLIGKGANVNAKDKFGRTPIVLSICAKSHFPVGYTENRANLAEERNESIKLLLEGGSDLNQKIHYRGEKTVLELAIVRKDIEAINIIIEYAVKIEAMENKPLFDEHNLAVMNADPDARSHYSRCQAELTAMKSKKINNTLVTYFSLLAESVQVLTGFARNKQLVNRFKSDNHQIAYPIYSSQLDGKFEEAICRQNRIEKVSTVLSETLQFAEPSHVCFETILKYLSQADVDLIINSASHY